MGSQAHPGSHKVKKYQPSSRQEERPPHGGALPDPHTPTHSLPWYKVVELVRTEDFLDLFFYFGLERMQDTGEREQIQMRLLLESSAKALTQGLNRPALVTCCLESLINREIKILVKQVRNLFSVWPDYSRKLSSPFRQQLYDYIGKGQKQGAKRCAFDCSSGQAVGCQEPRGMMCTHDAVLVLQVQLAPELGGQFLLPA